MTCYVLASAAADRFIILPLNISYMGTKRELALSVTKVIDQAQGGMLLDAFAGMGAIAEAVAPRRNVWTNDVQHFAHLVGKCLFCSSEDPPTAYAIVDAVEEHYLLHCSKLSTSHAIMLSICDDSIATNSSDIMNHLRCEVRNLSAQISEFDYNCFLKIYSGGYFSVRQCIEIDSIVKSLDFCVLNGSLNQDQRDWALIALGRSCLKLANTPGHFAQYLKPNDRTLKRVQRQARRSVWAEWLVSISDLRPVGSPAWRARNRATQSDSLALTANKEILKSAAVVYCDPPYTSDQYSRFYHVWETLVLYDYPSVTGAGAYRPDRFTTSFCIKSKVKEAFQQIIASAYEAGADLVLSYPTNGLLHQVGYEPIDLLQEKYPKARLAVDFAHKHSTFGASKGSAKAQVSERVYLAMQ